MFNREKIKHLERRLEWLEYRLVCLDDRRLELESLKLEVREHINMLANNVGMEFQNTPAKTELVKIKTM